MKTLGDMLGQAKRSAAGFQAWIEAADPDLAGEVRTATGRSGDSVASFARAAMADFNRLADEEDWAALTRIVRDDPDPGAACLVAMVRWRLAAKSCDAHSAHGHEDRK